MSVDNLEPAAAIAQKGDVFSALGRFNIDDPVADHANSTAYHADDVSCR